MGLQLQAAQMAQALPARPSDRAAGTRVQGMSDDRHFNDHATTRAGPFPPGGNEPAALSEMNLRTKEEE